MIKKLFFSFVYIFLIFIIVFIVEQFVRRYTGDRYYLPSNKHWDLEKFTNLFGQHNGKEELVLYHTSVEYTDIVGVKKPEGLRRIILIGTSSTAGYRVDKEDTYASVLQRGLDSYYGEGEFEVINGAVGGYVSYQLLIYFKEVLLKLSPDVAVLYLGKNDCDYSAGITDREYYERVKKAAAKIEKNEEKKKRLFKYGLIGFNPLHRFFTESRLLGFLYYNFLDVSNRNILRFKTILCTPPSDQEYVLKEFIRLSREHSFMLVFVPEQIRKETEEAGLINIIPYHNLMRRIAEEEDIILIDAKPILRAYPDRELFLDYVHLTPFGHSLIGDRLLELVQRVYKYKAVCLKKHKGQKYLTLLVQKKRLLERAKNKQQSLDYRD